MRHPGVGCGSWRRWNSSLPAVAPGPEHGEPSERRVLLHSRSSRSSYLDEDCDSLALCDPMQRAGCDVDSLPESCFDSGLSTLRDSNEYDSEVEYKHQRAFKGPRGMQESLAGDASDTDVSPGVPAPLGLLMETVTPFDFDLS